MNAQSAALGNLETRMGYDGGGAEPTVDKRGRTRDGDARAIGEPPRRPPRNLDAEQALLGARGAR